MMMIMSKEDELLEDSASTTTSIYKRQENQWTQIWKKFQISTEDLPPIQSKSDPHSWNLIIWRVQPKYGILLRGII